MFNKLLPIAIITVTITSCQAAPGQTGSDYGACAEYNFAVKNQHIVSRIMLMEPRQKYPIMSSIFCLSEQYFNYSYNENSYFDATPFLKKFKFQEKLEEDVVKGEPSAAEQCPKVGDGVIRRLC